jgi:hypothetical protein
MNRAHATREAWHPQTRQDIEAILRELDVVLASPHFCNSKRYPTLLRHIVENTLAGKLDLLKERTLGVEVFDRPATYDTNTDTVVRYTAGEVRKRLLLYYSEHGSTSGIRISLPAGSYVADFFRGDDGHLEPGVEPPLTPPHAHDSEVETHSIEVHEPEKAPMAIDALGAGLGTGDATVVPVGSRSRNRILGLAVLAAMILAAVVAGWNWRKPKTVQSLSAVDAFWAPVLRDQHSLIICTGSSVFAPQNYSGVETAGKDIDYTFVSMQIASAISQVSSTTEHYGTPTQLASAATASLPDLREHSVALLGGYNNQWTLRFVEHLRFHFVEGEGTREIIVDGAHPESRWERDGSLPYSSADDYALVARFRDATIDGWVVVLAGLGRNGTEAAAQFATSPHYLELFQNSLGGGLASHNVEAVLKVNVIDGKTGAPSLLAVHSW